MNEKSKAMLTRTNDDDLDRRKKWTSNMRSENMLAIVQESLRTTKTSYKFQNGLDKFFFTDKDILRKEEENMLFEAMKNAFEKVTGCKPSQKYDELLMVDAKMLVAFNYDSTYQHTQGMEWMSPHMEAGEVSGNDERVHTHEYGDGTQSRLNNTGNHAGEGSKWDDGMNWKDNGCSGDGNGRNCLNENEMKSPIAVPRSGIECDEKSPWKQNWYEVRLKW